MPSLSQSDLLSTIRLFKAMPGDPSQIMLDVPPEVFAKAKPSWIKLCEQLKGIYLDKTLTSIVLVEINTKATELMLAQYPDLLVLTCGLAENFVAEDHKKIIGAQ